LYQVLHSRKFLRHGTVVGAFKLDVKTVYDTAGIFILYFIKHFHWFFFQSRLTKVERIDCNDSKETTYLHIGGHR